MAGAHSTRWNARPFRIKPCLGQRSENNVHSVSSDRCDVLQDDVSGLYQANDSHEFVEQPRAGAFLDAGLFAGKGNVLTGKSSANNVG